MYRRAALALIFASSSLAQQWELGVAGGYGIYRSGTIFSGANQAVAGVRNRFTVSALLGERLYDHLGGEFRYTYHDGDPFLASGSTKTNIQGQSHAFHYDLLFYLQSDSRRISPYLAAGVGAKLYVVSGPENPQAPLGNIAHLTARDDLKALFTGGGGLKVRLGRNVALRIDFRDYVTTFPKKLIAPAPYGTARGIFQQFTPMLGISYVL